MVSAQSSDFRRCCGSDLVSVSARETDQIILEQEKTAQDFLKRSAKRALTRSIKDGLHHARYLLYCTIGIAILVGLLFVRSYVKRAFFSEILLGIDTSEEDYVINAIKIAEGLTNPFVSTSSKSEYYTYLSELLDKNWPNSPLGMGFYKWALNDVAIAADSRYLYTANGKGQVVLWDTYTGEITKRENVSSSPLAAIAISPANNRAVIDSTGRLFVSFQGKTWSDTGITCPITWTDAVRIMISDASHSIVVIDRSQVFYLTYSEDRLSESWCKTYDEIKVRVSKGHKDIIKSHAAQKDGGSVNAFINRAIDEAMQRDAARAPAGGVNTREGGENNGND